MNTVPYINWKDGLNPSQEVAGSSPAGTATPPWIIRKTVKAGRYIYAVVPEHPRAIKHGYVYEHIIVMENKLGRLLDPENEEVHHEDKNGRNNDPRNLKVLTVAEHRMLHALEVMKPPIVLTCANCGVLFERRRNQSPKSKGYKLAFCSRRCNGKFNGLNNRSNKDLPKP